MPRRGRVMGKIEVRTLGLCFLVGPSLAIAESALAAPLWLMAKDLAPVSDVATLGMLSLGMAGLALHPTLSGEMQRSQRLALARQTPSGRSASSTRMVLRCRGRRFEITAGPSRSLCAKDV